MLPEQFGRKPYLFLKEKVTAKVLLGANSALARDQKIGASPSPNLVRIVNVEKYDRTLRVL